MERVEAGSRARGGLATAVSSAGRCREGRRGGTGRETRGREGEG